MALLCFVLSLCLLDGIAIAGENNTALSGSSSGLENPYAKGDILALAKPAEDASEEQIIQSAIASLTHVSDAVTRRSPLW